ncbi:MAG TPA: DUF4199 domain-containing protein [Gemmatimonadaceae bacterium]|nr:DUF4199 domain-containing protein [Gemmatimonadaceae bacterium]
MKKTVWTFGLISGAILSVMMAITVPFEDQIGSDRGLIIGYTTMVLSFLLVFFGVRSYRDNVAGGSVSFGRAFAVGLLIVLISSLCYVATWEAIYFKFAPSFAAKLEAYNIEQAKKRASSPAEVEAKVAEAKVFSQRYQHPLFNAAITLLEPLPVGLLIALISAAVLRRRRSRESNGALATSMG